MPTRRILVAGMRGTIAPVSFPLSLQTKVKFLPRSLFVLSQTHNSANRVAHAQTANALASAGPGSPSYPMMPKDSFG